MNMEDNSEPKESVEEGAATQTRTCTYKLRMKGSWYKLEVPLTIPYTGNPRELAARLINAHQLPCYLEQELCKRLERFGREETLQYLDEQAEGNLYGGSVLEEVGTSKWSVMSCDLPPPPQGSETEQTIDKWVSHFAETNIEFALPLDTREGAVEKAMP